MAIDYIDGIVWYGPYIGARSPDTVYCNAPVTVACPILETLAPWSPDGGDDDNGDPGESCPMR